MSGNPGHTGHTGSTGRKGLQGTPYGAPGTTFYSPTGRVTTSTVLGGNMTVLTNAYGTTYLLSAVTDPINVTLPSGIGASDYGAFWTFRNTYTNTKVLAFTNTAGIVYNGDSAATSISLQGGNAITLVFSGSSNTTSTYIAI